ncbi:MAG: hypothetical protein H6560_15185 [Lewinellaceae bacterium]|nr:hypothetical protein [Lewinellaceae bacterium]
MSEPPLYAQQAWLWDDGHSIPGRLEILPGQLGFRLQQYDNSHLRLEIRLEDIESCETFLLFGLARAGLRIQTADGRASLFIMDDPARVKQKLEERAGL